MYAVNVLPQVAAASCRQTSWSPMAVLRCWRTRAVTRAELRRLLATSPHLVVDLGFDPAMVAGEAAKPFWRA